MYMNNNRNNVINPTRVNKFKNDNGNVSNNYEEHQPQHVKIKKRRKKF